AASSEVPDHLEMSQGLAPSHRTWKAAPVRPSSATLASLGIDAGLDPSYDQRGIPRQRSATSIANGRVRRTDAPVLLNREGTYGMDRRGVIAGAVLVAAGCATARSLPDREYVPPATAAYWRQLSQDSQTAIDRGDWPQALNSLQQLAAQAPRSAETQQ